MTLYLLAAATLLPPMFGLRGYLFYYYVLVEPWAAIAFATGAAIWFGARARVFAVVVRPIAILAAIVAVVEGGVQVRYQAIAPSTANPIALSHVCCYVPYATLIGDQLKPICESTNRACNIDWPRIMEGQKNLGSEEFRSRH